MLTGTGRRDPQPGGELSGRAGDRQGPQCRRPGLPDERTERLGAAGGAVPQVGGQGGDRQREDERGHAGRPLAGDDADGPHGQEHRGAEQQTPSVEPDVAVGAVLDLQDRPAPHDLGVQREQQLLHSPGHDDPAARLALGVQPFLDTLPVRGDAGPPDVQGQPRGVRTGAPGGRAAARRGRPLQQEQQVVGGGEGVPRPVLRLPERWLPGTGPLRQPALDLQSPARVVRPPGSGQCTERESTLGQGTESALQPGAGQVGGGEVDSLHVPARSCGRTNQKLGAEAGALRVPRYGCHRWSGLFSTSATTSRMALRALGSSPSYTSP